MNAALEYDRRQIMADAWATVRRLGNNGQSLHKKLARGLSCAWFRAKDKMKVTRLMAAREAEVAALTAEPSATLRRMIEDTENRDRLGHDGLERLSMLRRALTAAPGSP